MEKLKKFLKACLFYLIQWTWGFPVNIVGYAAYRHCRKKGYKSEKFGYATITYVPWDGGGLTLGLFIFMRADHPNAVWNYNTPIHEYGHTWQTLVLGPFYWVVIALPSYIWCNGFEWWRRKYHKSYYIFYPEKWANAWGQKHSGMKMKFVDPEDERATRPVEPDKAGSGEEDSVKEGENA